MDVLNDDVRTITFKLAIEVLCGEVACVSEEFEVSRPIPIKRGKQPFENDLYGDTAARGRVSGILDGGGDFFVNHGCGPDYLLPSSAMERLA